MRRHDGVHAAGNGRAEGRQFHGAQAFLVVRDEGHGVVRVDGRVAVAGEVLGRHGQAAGALAAHGGHAVFDDGVGILAIGAHADDGVVAIVVYVQHGGEQHVDAHLAHLVAADLVHAFAVGRRTGGLEGHGGGNWRHALLDAHHHAAFLVDGDEQRRVGHFRVDLLQFAAQGRHLRRRVHIAAEQDHAAHLLVAYQGLDMLVRLQGVEAHHEQLSYFLAQTLLHAATPPVFILMTTSPYSGPGDASGRTPEKLPYFVLILVLYWIWIIAQVVIKWYCSAGATVANPGA